MLEQAESELAELVVREQRGFRRIVFAGMAILLVLVLISTTMGVYYFLVSRNLGDVSLSLQKQAFDTRRLLDTQSNRISDQEAAIRAAYADMRVATGEAVGTVSPEQTKAARAAAIAYVQRGRRVSLAEERVLERIADRDADAPMGAFSRGVLALRSWQSSGETFPPGGALPPQLQEAVDAFKRAGAADAELAGPAQSGIAWVQFLSAQARDWNAGGCDEVLTSVEAATSSGGPAPQPLYLRAQCERKLGRTKESLAHYAQALEASVESADSGEDNSELMVKMNAFHGVGTTLIASAEDTAGLEQALDTARKRCEDGDGDAAKPMNLAVACLRNAIDLRRRLRQSPNQVSGSGENLTFALLRDGDYAGAFKNTEEVQRSGLFAWNELLRAMTAADVQRAPNADAAVRQAAAKALPEARRNVSFFTPAQFAVCELQALLSPSEFDKAIALLRETHPNDEIACAR